MRKILCLIALVAATHFPPAARVSAALAGPTPPSNETHDKSGNKGAKPLLPEVPAALTELKPELSFDRRIAAHLARFPEAVDS